DGRRIGTTPISRASLETGRHTISLSKPLYKSVADTVEIGPQTRPLHYELPPDHGRLAVRTTPSVAGLVFIDEEATGDRTPARIEQVRSGERAVRVERCGFQSAEERIRVTPGAEATLTLKLEPLTRGGAVLRAAVFPGWGQDYLGRDTEARWMRAGIAAGVILATAAVIWREQAIDDYQEARDAYERSVAPGDIEYWYEEMRSRYRTIDDAEDWRNRGFFVMGAVWLTSILDAYLSFPLDCEPGVYGRDGARAGMTVDF
ncbi:MAG: PEGA domain-containing protein, partial [Candidatus Eisenbacteria bacterium]|nr:PEGA domain-containing protein [Candidatus Eisenbacteria bacterium]